jgi:hypothetical protein
MRELSPASCSSPNNAGMNSFQMAFSTYEKVPEMAPTTMYGTYVGSTLVVYHRGFRARAQTDGRVGF